MKTNIEHCEAMLTTEPVICKLTNRFTQDVREFYKSHKPFSASDVRKILHLMSREYWHRVLVKPAGFKALPNAYHIELVDHCPFDMLGNPNHSLTHRRYDPKARNNYLIRESIYALRINRIDAALVLEDGPPTPWDLTIDRLQMSELNTMVRVKWRRGNNDDIEFRRLQRDKRRSR